MYIIILFMIHLARSEISNVTKEKFVAVHNGDVHLYKEFGEIYHIFNITFCHQKLEEVIQDTTYTQQLYATETHLDIEMIKSNLKQLEYGRSRRAIDEIGSAFKWITGVPDRAEMQEIKEKLNQLIEGNNIQKIINHRIENQMTSIDQKKVHRELKNNIKIRYLLSETSKMIQTINLAKADILNTELFNLEEIENMIEAEYNLPLINILEYSTFKIVKTQNLLVIQIKYPIIEEKCEFYNIEAITQERYKLILEKYVAKCKNNYQSIQNCNHELDTTICKKINNSNCLPNMLQNQIPQCNITNEKMQDISIIDDGIILVNGKNLIDNKTYVGTFLITFKNSTNINNTIYFNHKERIIEHLKHTTSQEYEIDKFIETQKIDLKIPELKFIEKIETELNDHPVRSMISIMLTTVIIMSIAIFLIKLLNCLHEKHIAYQANQNQMRLNEILTLQEQRIITSQGRSDLNGEELNSHKIA